MTLVSQAEFARMCGVSRQAVVKCKAAGRLVLRGNQVDVEATDARMQRYCAGGTPLKKTSVDTVDSRLTKPGAVDKNAVHLSAGGLFDELDGTQEFDCSREGLERRATESARNLGFDARLNGDDIVLRRDGQPTSCAKATDSTSTPSAPSTCCAGGSVSMRSSPPTADVHSAIRVLARPFGTRATVERCEA